MIYIYFKQYFALKTKIIFINTKKQFVLVFRSYNQISSVDTLSDLTLLFKVVLFVYFTLRYVTDLNALEKRIIDNIQNGNGIEKVSTTIRLPKTVSERIEKIVENNDNYSRNQLITDLVEIGLERIEQHLNN